MSGAALSEHIEQAEIRFLVEKNADGIIVVDENGIVLFANPAIEHIFGREAELLVGSPIGVPLVAGETTEITVHKPGGKQVDAEIRVVDTYWGNRPARLASIRDISVRKAAEEQLRHAGKMEAIGRLTAGIAHDFNNLLTVVLGNLEQVQRRVDDPSLLKMLGNAMSGARRAAVLTERLLAFARKKPLEPRLLDTNELVIAMSDLLRRTLGENIKVKTRLAEELWLVESDQTELEASILNLVVNARDAMPSGGEVTVETRNVELDAKYAAAEAEVCAGPYIQIAVSDTGAGMPADVLQHVFEPFFTTKPDGRGTGLGLSQVYGFVKQSGGHIKLYSEPGYGTTAKIYLPKARVQERAFDTMKASVDSLVIPQAVSQEAILVVEDDEDVRSFTVNSLRDLGYAVFEAPNGELALQILKRESSIRLLLTDLGLPGGLDGKTLASRAQAMRQDLCILITTAYAGSVLMHEGRLDPQVDLLSKPFTLSALAHRVRERLDRNRASPRRPKRVLIVDDEPALRMAVASLLAAEGYRLDEAASFVQAIEVLETLGGQLDGAVIDLGLPDRPGEELIPIIQRLRQDIPIILMSGHVGGVRRDRFSDDGRVYVLPKPFDAQSFLDILRQPERD
jgi:signal transduction histidine kinase/CheY-like chemotaxis protein